MFNVKYPQQQLSIHTRTKVFPLLTINRVTFEIVFLVKG